MFTFSREKMLILVFLLISTCFHISLLAGQSYWGIGMRQHSENQLIEKYPFTDKDISFGISYEYHDLGGYWLLTLNYAPELKGTNSIKKVISPGISLVMTENNWKLGLGFQKNYIQTEIGENYWDDISWQLLTGYGLKLAGVLLDLYVFLPFTSFNDIRFKSNNLEYGIAAVFKF